MTLFEFEDGFEPIKVFAGREIWEAIATQRTSIIFGASRRPWAPAAFRIDEVIVQLEKNLNDWDLLAVNADGRSRLIRPVANVYELQINIPPDTEGFFSDFFYRCPICYKHIYKCDCQQKFRDRGPEIGDENKVTICPDCGGKVQSIARNVRFCLDCDWDQGLKPLR